MRQVRLALLAVVPLLIAVPARFSPDQGLIRQSASQGASPVGTPFIGFEVSEAEVVASLANEGGTPAGPLLLAPSGDRVAFTADVENDVLALLDLRDGQVRRLGEGMSRPIWSPSGRALLVTYALPGERFPSVAIVDPERATLRPITTQPVGGPAHRDVPAGFVGTDVAYQRTAPERPGVVEIHRASDIGRDDRIVWQTENVSVLTDQPIAVAGGVLLATASEGTVSWHRVDWEGGHTALGSGVSTRRITQASPSPDGALLAYAAGVQLLLAPTGRPGEPVAVLPFSEGPGAGFAWSPTGDRLLVSDGATLVVYDVADRIVLTAFANAAGVPIGAPLWQENGIVFLQRGGEVAVRRIPLVTGTPVAWPAFPTPTRGPEFEATIAALTTRQAALAREAEATAAVAADNAAALASAATAAAARDSNTLATAQAQAIGVAATATAVSRSGQDAAATADAQATADALSDAATVAAFAARQAEQASNIDNLTRDQATAAALATTDALAAQATIQALATNEANLAAAAASRATQAAQLGAVATANAASGANAVATAQARATVVVEIAAVATQNAESGANDLATARAEAAAAAARALAAESAVAQVTATGAAIATATANAPPPPVVITLPTATPTAVISMSQQYVEETIQVDADGLLIGSAAAEEDARDALGDALAPYVGCRVGVVSTFGGGGDGVAVANALNDLLLAGFPDLFEGAAEPDDFFDQTLPRGAVTLRLYFFSGCPAAESPTAPTETTAETTPRIELRPA